MKRILLHIGFLGLISVATVGNSQQRNPSRPASPPKLESAKADPPKAVEPKPADVKEADEKSGDSVNDAFAEIIGDGSIKFGGRCTIQNDVSGKPTIRMDKGVHILGTLLSLNCDDLVLDQGKQVMNATGTVDFTRTESGEKISGSCGRMTSHLDTKVTVLEVNPKVRKIASDGSEQVMSGGKITMTQNDNGTDVVVDQGGEINVKSAPKKVTKPDASKPVSEIRIDNKNVGSIPAHKPGVSN